MAKKSSPTEPEILEITRRFQAGMKVTEIKAQTGWSYMTIRKVVDRLGLTREKPRKPKPTSQMDDSELVNFKAGWDKLDSTVKGTISESYAKTRLSELGFDVWEPVCQNHKTDLLIVGKSGIRKLQVKSGTYDLPTKCFRVNFNRRRRGGKRADYDLEDVDFFIVHCAGIHGPLYIIPATAIKNRSPRLFPHRAKLLEYRDTEMEQYLDAFDLIFGNAASD